MLKNNTRRRNLQLYPSTGICRAVPAASPPSHPHLPPVHSPLSGCCARAAPAGARSTAGSDPNFCCFLTSSCLEAELLSSKAPQLFCSQLPTAFFRSSSPGSMNSLPAWLHPAVTSLPLPYSPSKSLSLATQVSRQQQKDQKQPHIFLGLPEQKKSLLTPQPHSPSHRDKPPPGSVPVSKSPTPCPHIPSTVTKSISPPPAVTGATH